MYAVNSWWLADYGLLKLHIWIHAIIICEGHWKIHFMLTIHILCKNWNVILKLKLLVFQNQLPCLAHNIIRRFRLLRSWQLTIQGSCIKYSKCNCWGKTNAKFLTYAGFLHDEDSMTAVILRDMSGGTLSMSYKFLKSEGNWLLCLLH
jgi:hypothetical protein